MTDVYLTPEAAQKKSHNTHQIPYDAVLTPEKPDTGWVLGIHFDKNDKVKTTDWYNRNYVVLIDAEEESEMRIHTGDKNSIRRYYRFGDISTERERSIKDYIKTVQ